MQINVKFFAVDVPIGFSNCSFDLLENSILEDVLNECLKLPQINIEEQDFKASLILLNGNRAELNQKLNDGDTITILRTLGGG